MMYGKAIVQNFVEESAKNPAEEVKDKIEVTRSDCGKIVIQVNLSKESLHNSEISQIIREIFELSNHDVQVEKLVLPTDENTWQVRKTGNRSEKEEAGNLLPPSVSMDLAEKRRKTSRMKLMKHNKLYKIKLPKSLGRARQGSRRKLSERLSREFGLGQFDVSEVHSSPAITNLLSQLYPNPYSLISLLEVQNPTGYKGAVDANDSCKIRFRAKDGLCKESDIEHEFAVFSVPSVPAAKIPANDVESLTAGGMGVKKTAEKIATVKKDSVSENDLFQFTGQNQTRNDIEDVNTGCRTVKRMIIRSGEMFTGTNDSGPSHENGPENAEEDQIEGTDETKLGITKSVGSDNRKKSKMTECKIMKKKVQKIAHATAEKLEEDKIKRNSRKIPTSTGEKVSISAIHPMSLQRTNLGTEEEINQQMTEKNLTNDKDPKAVLKPMTVKKKCIIQYLKLIKDMYEAEERCLQSKVDDAWNFALEQVEKPGKKPVKDPATRKNQQTVPNTGKEQDGRFKHSQSQTPKARKIIAGNKICNPEVQQKRPEPLEEAKKIGKDNPVLTIPNIEFTQRKNMMIPEENTLTLRSAYKDPSEAPCSCLSNQQKGLQLDMFTNPSKDFGVYNSKPNTIRTDTFVFRRKIPKSNRDSADGVPIEVINRNVLETNRKIDSLIRHIDNSMDWLSKSEKKEPSNICSVVEKANDPSEKLDQNLGTRKSCLISLPESSKKSCRLYENNNLTVKRSDLLFAHSYQSLHIFPVDRGIGSVHIRTGAFFNTDSASSKWFATNTMGPWSLSNLRLPLSRSVNYLTSNKRMENFIVPRGFAGARLKSEVPELRTATEPMLIVVENRNEHGSFAEDVNRRNQCRSPSETRQSSQSACDMQNVDSGKSLSSSLSVSVIALDESSSALRSVIMQEITWSLSVEAPSAVTQMHYRNEQLMVFTIAEASVVHVARASSFMALALMSVAQELQQEPKQQSSVIISLHKCSSSVKTNAGLEESGKFVVLPSDVKFSERASDSWHEEVPGMDLKVLKRAESPRRKREIRDWDPFQSESSMEMYDGDKASISKMGALPNRSNKLDRYGKNLMWLHPLPDPYESNPADEEAETLGMKQTNFQAIRSGPQQTAVGGCEQEHFPDEVVRRKLKFDGSAPPIFRYLSSETSNTSLDEKGEMTLTLDTRKKVEHTRKSSRFSNTNVSLFPDINKSNDSTNSLIGQQEAKADDKSEDGDSSSTSSFKSSNDFSDVSELPDLKYPKKRPKSRSHFLDKLFHELRSFRKCLTRRRGPKRKSAQDEPNEFEDALSELNVEMDRENKVLLAEEKQTADEAVAVNTMRADEVGSHAMPRKIFKTSFRGKESVTELMIDLKDVSISEVSDISVEKRKLSTDHTKISIIISKQAGDGALCCTNQGYRKGDRCPSREGSYHSLKNGDTTKCLGWKKEASKSDDDDDDDYKSADSDTQARSLENIPGENIEEDMNFRAKMLISDSLIEPRRRSKTFGRHKFDFYKKMEDTTSYDSLKLDANEFLFGKPDKEIAPLKKALADMQFRVQNIQKNTFCTSDEYYERALRMAKMSAGYCRSCKSKTVIPEDPLGIYQKLIPRTNLRSPYSRQRKYYFKTTSSTNSSFYSIHSSNSDVSDKFCQLNSSSSIVTNGLSRSRAPVLGESSGNIPLFLGRHLYF